MLAGDPLGLPDALRWLRAQGRHGWKYCKKGFYWLPDKNLWLWPILEVAFITIFSISPLLITAASRSLKSVEPVQLSDQLSTLLAGGQLMYYALGFVATAAWLLFVEIRRPKWAIPILGLIVFFVVIGVAITIGVDPRAADFNQNAFRDASYWVFTGGLITYLFTTILRAWQPKTLEQLTRKRESDFVSQVEENRKGA